MRAGVVMLAVWLVLLVAPGFANGEERKPFCPEPFEPSRCLGTSGRAGVPPQDKGENCEGVEERDKIVWNAGMAGHSHYTIVPEKTAVLVIDPQLVYANCPAELSVESLIAPPPTEEGEEFDMHSPLCCEKFKGAVENINKITKAARESGAHVVHVGHVYRDLNGDGVLDNEKDHSLSGRIGGLGGKEQKEFKRQKQNIEKKYLPFFFFFFFFLLGFDVLGWVGWPMAFNLWNANFPWAAYSPLVDVEPTDYYTEKTSYSATTDIVTEKLEELGVDTVVVTGFMTQFCVTTTSRAAHDYGFRVVVAEDALDGPKLLELISGIDENAAIPFYLSIAVADVTTSEDLVENFGRK